MLEPSWRGRRISVRRVVEREPDGRLRTADVVGDLVGLDAVTAVIESHGSLVEVPVATVVAARRAEPSTADELGLDAVAARGIRSADTGAIGGWQLRADHGFLRRANSVLPLRAPGVSVDEALALAHDWYAERGLPVLIAIPTEARRLLDNDLGERGWHPETESHVMTARLDHLRPAGDPDPRVALAELPDERWLSLYRGGEGAGDVGRALLTRHDTVAFASVVEGGQVIAIGRAVVDDGWLGVSGVEVEPDARRQGLATAVMDALVAWGTAHGATRTYLQVETGNTAAVTLYDRLGYWVHHDYRYRREPGPDDPPVRRLW